ncbi:hypothetical protein L4D00_22110 [Photobacterium swingsii]|uniref:hypothetical protein n=1 Tax=Photobacterium swingsii TaxID=680026 RepID=UPI003D100D20
MIDYKALSDDIDKAFCYENDELDIFDNATLGSWQLICAFLGLLIAALIDNI